METVPWEPIVSLIAGVMIFLMPRLLNYVVATYLVIIGVLGLMHERPIRAAQT